jgi:hypothetical protein
MLNNVGYLEVFIKDILLGIIWISSLNFKVDLKIISEYSLIN